MGSDAEDRLTKELSEARQRIAHLEHALYERNRVEGAVRGSEERYRRLVENAHDVLWVFDLNLGYTYVSPSVKHLRGYTVEEVMQQRLDQVLTPESVTKARDLFEREKEREYSGQHHEPGWAYTTDFEMIHKDGHTFWAEMTMNAFYDEEGNIRGIMGISRDVSERKRAEEELRKHHDRLEEMVRERTVELSRAVEQLKKEIAVRTEAEEKLRRSEERFRAYFELSNDVMFSYDNQFRVQSVTPNVERNLGYKPEELVGKTFLEAGVLNPDCLNDAIGSALKVLAGETVYSSVYEFITRSGEHRFGEVSGVPLVKDGRVEGEVTVARDITERITMQKSLQESEERYRTTLQTLPEAVCILNAGDLRYIYVNKAFCSTTGYPFEEVIGKTPFELGLPASPEEGEACEAILRSLEQVSTMEHRCLKKDGTVLDTIITSRPVVYGGEPCIVMIISDITAFKQVEEEKKRVDIKAQKMEAIGTLAAGIAHDFNNILTAIIGYAKMSMKDFLLIKKEDKDLSVVQSDLMEVRNAAYRARDLVNHILAFSRHAEKDYSPIKLSSALKNSLKLMKASLPGNIRIREDIEGDELILGDQTQIHIVLTNLCTNAAYAMDNSGGELEVSLKPVYIHGPAPDMEMQEGAYLKLTVKDSGHGMPAHVMAKIFDPYFTTKTKGKGVGLGLSVVHGIVKSHGGAIHCTSHPGKGTTFEIFLPRYDPAGAVYGKQTGIVQDNEGRRILDLDRDLPAGEADDGTARSMLKHGREKKC